MNYYTNKYKDKFYCLDPIDPKYHFRWTLSYDDHDILYCDTLNISNIIHRVDGPAVEMSNGYKYWYYMGKEHRDDGPSYEDYNGNKLWYYYGEQINYKTNEEFLKIIKMKAFL